MTKPFWSEFEKMIVSNYLYTANISETVLNAGVAIMGTTLKTGGAIHAVSLNLGTTPAEVITAARVLQNITSISQSILPTSSATYTLGDNDHRWNSIHLADRIWMSGYTVLDSDRTLQNILNLWITGFLYVTDAIVITAAKVLQNVTANASIITAGAFAEAQIPHTFANAITINNTLNIGEDCNLYRVAANELKTDDSLAIALNLSIGGNTNMSCQAKLISNGAITLPTVPIVYLSPQSGTTDDLDYIPNGVAGQVIHLAVAVRTYVITLKHMTNNLDVCGVDIKVQDGSGSPVSLIFSGPPNYVWTWFGGGVR